MDSEAFCKVPGSFRNNVDIISDYINRSVIQTEKKVCTSLCLLAHSSMTHNLTINIIVFINV